MHKNIITNEILLKKHRLKILAKYGMTNFELDDFTLRSPESMCDNPFMRFIGYNYPVKIYREMVYIKEKKVSK